MKSKLWIATNAAILVIGSLSFSLLYFLVWDKLQSYESVVYFNLWIFIGLLTASIPSSLLVKVVSPRFILVVGLVLQAFVYYYTAQGGLDLLVIGFFYGLGYSFLLDSIAATSLSYNQKSDLTKINSINQIIKALTALLAPSLVSYLITNFGFEISLTTLSISILPVIFVLVLMSGQRVKVKVDFLKILSWITTSSVLRGVSINSFAVGMILMFSWGLLDVLTLDRLGGIGAWAQLATVIALLTIIVSKLIGDIDYAKNLSLIKTVTYVPFVLFGSSVILLITVPTEAGFIAFIILFKLLSAIFYVASTSYMSYSISQWDVDLDYGDIEVTIFVNFFINLGMLSLALLLFLIPAGFINESSLVWIMWGISTLILLFTKKL